MNDQSYKSPMAALLWSTTLYGFGQLYNRSHDINRELRANNVPEPTRKTKGLGELYGLASGMTLGLAWSSFFYEPLYSGLGFAILGIIVGRLVENRSTTHAVSPERYEK
ncbi:hypothetical protein RWE15_06425 [Virgibacillus halophilus]|uniref:Uncharacterized protein n=1 Tax=Tigheibacillus halophilus TaxID=361280 RepID=A0ABU5C4C5_9BACI|nr:hypothetical protein [Virgibacillus halophilus]